MESGTEWVTEVVGQLLEREQAQRQDAKVPRPQVYTLSLLETAA